MKTFTQEESAALKKFINEHSEKIRDYILRSGFKTTATSIIEIGHFICKNSFMDFPDYEEEIPLELADSIMVLYHEYVTDDMTFEDLYDYVSNNIDLCLCAIIGAEN